MGRSPWRTVPQRRSVASLASRAHKKKHLKIPGYTPTSPRFRLPCHLHDTALTSPLSTSSLSPLHSFVFGFRGPTLVHYQEPGSECGFGAGLLDMMPSFGVSGGVTLVFFLGSGCGVSASYAGWVLSSYIVHLSSSLEHAL